MVTTGQNLQTAATPSWADLSLAQLASACYLFIIIYFFDSDYLACPCPCPRTRVLPPQQEIEIGVSITTKSHPYQPQSVICFQTTILQVVFGKRPEYCRAVLHSGSSKSWPVISFNWRYPIQKLHSFQSIHKKRKGLSLPIGDVNLPEVIKAYLYQ